MTKAFYVFLLAAVVLCGVMLYQENALLNSQAPFAPMTTLTPQQVDQKFVDADSLFVTFKLIATIGLFIITYVIAFQKKSPAGFYLLLTALFFNGFTLIDDFMFDDRFFAFRKSHGLWEGGFSAV